jgi:hypothetical protein
LTEFLSGHRLDRFGAAIPLSATEYKATWQRLRARYPADFTVTAEQARAWHRREAASCLQEKNGAAAFMHLLHGYWEGALLNGWPLCR